MSANLEERLGGTFVFLRRVLSLASTLALLLLNASLAAADVGEEASPWSPAFDIQGVIGEILSLESWNDGLLIGGSFHQAGSVRAENAAFWTGSEWERLADFDGPVSDWTVYGDGLVAAGQFRSVEGVSAQSIARLGDEGWFELGTGLENREDPERCIVRALHVEGDRLFVGGEFSHAGGEPAQGLAVWDGAKWTGLGAELVSQFDGVPATVEVLRPFNGGIAVGGSFLGTEAVPSQSLILWKDSGWESIDGGVDGVVLALLPLETGLAVGGNFRRDDLDVPLRSFGIWNGTDWENLGARISGFNPTIWDIALYGEDLAIAGAFSEVGDLAINKLAWWDGTTWRSFSSGILSAGQVNDLEVFGTTLVAGGTFTQAAGHSAYGLASWNGRSWNPIGFGFGMDAPVQALAAADGFLLAGGDFERAGRRSGERCSVWDGAAWLDIGANFNGRVHTVTARPNEFFVGGLFTAFDGGPTRHLAHRVGNEWLSPAGGAAAVVWDLTVWDDRIVATGAFRRAGNRPARYVASWDGQGWAPLGTGLGNTGRALQVYGSDLVIGGEFSTAGETDAEGIALWNGFDFEPLGAGVEGEILDFTIYEGDLIAAGELTRAGTVDVANIARWDGSQWQALGRSFDGPIRAVTVHQGRLVAGGSFRTVDGKPASGLAVWDGLGWNPVGAGVSGLLPGDPAGVHALESWEGSLFVGGDFIFAGDQPSHHIAAWEGPIPYQAWPGDGNNDGVVDGLDLLALGRHWGLSGPPRPRPGLDWTASAVEPWSVPGAAYADCDGSGVVDAKDVLGLVANWREDRRRIPGPLAFANSALSPESTRNLFGTAAASESLAAAAREMLAILPPSAPRELRDLLRTLAAEPSDSGGSGEPNGAAGPFKLDRLSAQPSAEWPVLQLSGRPDVEVRLRVFDIAGREVASGRIGPAAAGDNRVVDLGRILRTRPAGGIYFVRAESPGEAATLRILILD